MTYSHHRSWVEISKSAFAHNVANLRMLLGSSTIFAPVIKANAYGHGTYEMATLCQESPLVDMLCVGLLSDAIALRAHGITKPITVIGCIDTDPALALQHAVQLLVYSYASAHELSAIAAAHHAAFDVHIKIDTGLSRMGLRHTDAAAQIAAIAHLPGLRIVGVYSHLAQAQADDPSYSALQIRNFENLLAQLRTKNICPAYVHIANSAATMRFDIPACTMVRIGAGVYGLWPSPQTKKEVLTRYPTFSLRPMLSWKTKIMHIQAVDTGSFVGYNCTHQVTRPSRIAVLPVGYQDGYDIQFSNKGQVKIGTQYVPVVGRICMNHMMVDVTDIPDACINQEITLVGHEAPIDVYSMATLSGNNNIRELLTHINSLFERTVVS